MRHLRSSDQENVPYSSLKKGAKHIAKYLLSSFGENAFAFVIDEGGTTFPSILVFRGRPNSNATSVAGFEKSYDSVVAFPAVVEKGYIDVHLTVKSP